MHKWTPEQYDFLRNNIAGVSYADLTAMFNKHFNLDLKITTISATIKRLDLRNGMDTKFKKGLASHNKGQKMPSNIYEKAKPTMFKPGNVPPNTDPIGTEKMSSDGYIYVKVDNQPKAKKYVNWKLKHRLIYEREVGPIPNGYLVAFADGDRTNFDVKNLILISPQEKMLMARYKFHKNDAELTKAGLNVTKLMLATSNRRNKHE